MKDGRFEIGDIVVGTAEADNHYSITKKGWVGRVVKFVDGKSDYSLKSSNHTIILSGIDGENLPEFDVCHRYFKLCDDVPHYLKITGQQMPACCGECFAFDDVGCKFNATVLTDKVWK